MENIGLEWWILYVEIAVIGISVMLYLRNIVDSTYKAEVFLEDICTNTELANSYLFDTGENTGGRLSTDDPD